MTISVMRTGPGEVPPDATEHMVRMRDGVRLATDVYLPEGASTVPGPTVLTRLPYDKDGEYTFMPRVARYFVASGYRVVVQDVRGKFRSEGETLQFVNEAYDGYDTLDWIVEQAWSDGVVGMWGDSYYGYTQWAAASTAHPALRAMVPRVTGTRLGELPVPGPHERVIDVEMGVHRFYTLSMFHDNDILEWDLDWSRRPYSQQVEEFFMRVGSRSASYDLWYPRPVTLRRFPAGSPFDAPAVPVLMTIGWWDNCAPWQWADHRELSTRPSWRRHEYLLLEAIDHENNSHFDLFHPQHPATSERALAEYLDPAMEFFDVFLRGADADVPQVRWQLANSGDRSYRESETWPPRGVQQLRLYPSGAESASGEAPGGGLLPTPGPREAAGWVHDAANPVPSPAENAFAFLQTYPDERKLGCRQDVLVFSAPELTEPVDLVGPVGFEALVGSDGPEMDIFVRLCDESPDGAVHLVARGQVTVLRPAEGTWVEVDMGQVAYRFHAGHRWRLTVASSDVPEFVSAPGTGEQRWSAATTVPNHQILVLGGTEPASLVLSVLPAPVDPGRSDDPHL